jgi:hypothetical protein
MDKDGRHFRASRGVASKMSMPRDLASSINSTVAGRNLVINGGMDIWQRGTSFAYSNISYVYSADRFEHVRNAYTLGATASRQLAQLQGFRYCLRIQRDSGNTSTQPIFIDHSMETVESLRVIGKTVTLSFYARRGANYSASSNVLVARIITGTGTDQALKSYTNAAIPITLDCVLSSNWQRFSVTGVVTAGVNEIGLNFAFTPTGTAGANDFYEITGIQLEEGSSATPFSRAGGDFVGELARCQRYYWRTSTGGTYKGFGFGMGFSTTQARCMIQFPQTMRTTPVGVDYGGAIAIMDSVTGYLATSMSIDGNVMTPQSAYVNVNVASGLTQYRPYFLYSIADANAYVGFSAEL